MRKGVNYYLSHILIFQDRDLRPYKSDDPTRYAFKGVQFLTLAYNNTINNILWHLVTQACGVDSPTLSSGLEDVSYGD